MDLEFLDDAMTLEDKLMRAKVVAVDKAYNYMVEDSFEGIKEFKDLVSIIDIIDRSESKKLESPDTISNVVGNIMDEMKGIDDC